MRSTKVQDAKDNIDLLRIYDENGKYDYVYVKSKSRLLNKQYNKMDTKKSFVIIAIKPSVQNEY